MVTAVRACERRFRVAVSVSAAQPEYSLRQTHRRRGDRIGDVSLRLITMAGALGSVVLLGAIVWKVVDLAWPAIQHYGLSFIWGETWDPVRRVLRRAPVHLRDGRHLPDRLLLATPLAIAIALWLERARAARRARDRRLARRDAGRDPERRARSLGHPRARPLPRPASRAVAARPPRLHPALRPAVGDRHGDVHRRG